MNWEQFKTTEIPSKDRGSLLRTPFNQKLYGKYYHRWRYKYDLGYRLRVNEYSRKHSYFKRKTDNAYRLKWNAKQREYSYRNKQKIKLRMKIYFQNNKERYYAYKETQREKNRIRSKTLRAVKKGLINKKPCRDCGKGKVQAHHLDYTKPLDVIWLCKIHHEQLHHQTNRNTHDLG